MSLHPSVAAVGIAVRRGARRPRARVPACWSPARGGADSLALRVGHGLRGPRAGLARRRRDRRPRAAGGLRRARPTRVVAQMAALGVDETRRRPGSRSTAPGSGRRRPPARRGTPCSSEVARAVRRRRWCCSATPSTTRPRPCCSAWPAARAAGRWPGCGARFDHYRRPLLDVTRADTVTACQVEGLECWDDPHNDRPRASPGCGCAAGCCRCSRTSSARASPRRWPAPPTSCAPTWSCSTTSPTAALADAAPPTAASSVEALDRPAAADPHAGCCGCAALAAGAPAGELFHAARRRRSTRCVTDWHGQKWVDLPGHVRGVPAAGGRARGRARSVTARLCNG